MFLRANKQLKALGLLKLKSNFKGEKTKLRTKTDVVIVAGCRLWRPNINR